MPLDIVVLSGDVEHELAFVDRTTEVPVEVRWILFLDILDGIIKKYLDGSKKG